LTARRETVLFETRRQRGGYHLSSRWREYQDVTADDATLVRRCLRGEAEAIQQLVDRFQAEVYGLCVRLLNHRHDAEDVTQEVFLRVFRSLKGWDSARPLKPWIVGIAVNRCRTWLTQRVRRPELVDYLQDCLPGPAPDDSTELLQEIQAALAELRLEYRTVFVLFHEQGQPYEEIALVLERPVGTIKTWLHRARMEILERLRRRGMVPAEETSAGILPDSGDKRI
jgi:RNA polymerase sigma factor (sigma-70 family)